MNRRLRGLKHPTSPSRSPSPMIVRNNVTKGEGHKSNEVTRVKVATVINWGQCQWLLERTALRLPQIQYTTKDVKKITSEAKKKKKKKLTSRIWWRDGSRKKVRWRHGSNGVIMIVVNVFELESMSFYRWLNVSRRQDDVWWTFRDVKMMYDERFETSKWCMMMASGGEQWCLFD
jgi:hypothetical protein